MVVALAILLVTVFFLISLAYSHFDGLYFFLTWLAIGGVGTLLLIKIVDVYEIIEIRKYQKYREQEKLRQKDNDDNGNLH